MTRQQQWEAQYRANPYLAGKPDAHLAERYHYLIQNQTTLTELGQIGFETEPRLMQWLMAKITHMHLEFADRGELPAGLLRRSGIPVPTFPNPPAGVAAYRNRSRNESGTLFKFGKRRWLESMLDRGEIRFAPATSYAASVHNVAIRDDELAFTLYPAKFGARPKLLPAIAGDWIRMQHPSDYCMQCFSGRYALRMYDDFEADSCLIVYDAGVFGRRILSAVRTAYPDWFITAVGMTYIDPDDPGDAEVLIPVVKHIRYTYQQEQRILCHPKTPVRRLDAFTVTVGSLHDVAELVAPG